MKKLIATIAVAASLTAVSSTANAWGDREQGAVAGILGTIVVQEIFQRNRGPVTFPQDRGWGRTGNRGQFPPFRCNGSEVDCAYERGVYERKRIEWEDMKQEAYLCGRYPERPECSR